ncbi:pseudouridine-5'-phosphate glycosidase [Sneathiella litorea]|uniref:Pseudouridine-5-phosphate glycosidase n=1 Tax=Sneathiella litorea TaxID=2606216 RepID=A0A6L8WAL7_9PROT|nr:pseudouridine-5'-phosphate glycosidase [Sneathiella litorea]MZR31523.1 pseudouridine-5-phosphate glycosidase [Sneathiella litorea]
MRVSDEVQNALERNTPVVAIESAIIRSTGDKDIRLAKYNTAMDILGKLGVTPAVCAIIKGELVIGAGIEECEQLAFELDPLKTGRRDIPYMCSEQKSGLTTVSATMFMARRAGIRTVVTGAIGGVHREVHSSLDISSDLEALTEDDVVVACSGAKAILDLPKTLEYLETKNVPVIGCGTNEFTGYYTRSNLPLECRMDEPMQIAKMLNKKWDLELSGGAVVVADLSAEAKAVDHGAINELVNSAIDAAEKQGVVGKAVTPFLQKYLAERSDGELERLAEFAFAESLKLSGRLAVALASSAVDDV